jgi:hypothetical protein
MQTDSSAPARGEESARRLNDKRFSRVLHMFDFFSTTRAATESDGCFADHETSLAQEASPAANADRTTRLCRNGHSPDTRDTTFSGNQVNENPVRFSAFIRRVFPRGHARIWRGSACAN